MSVIDTAANRVLTQIAVGPRPRDTAFTPDSRRAYVTSETGASISVVDTATHTVAQTIRLTGEMVRPMGAVVSPDGTRLYVSTGRGGTVVALDTTTNKPIGSVAVGTRPWGLALSPDGARLYTANGPSNDVSVVDTATLLSRHQDSSRPVAMGSGDRGTVAAPLSTARKAKTSQRQVDGSSLLAQRIEPHASPMPVSAYERTAVVDRSRPVQRAGRGIPTRRAGAWPVGALVAPRTGGETRRQDPRAQFR